MRIATELLICALLAPATATAQQVPPPEAAALSAALRHVRADLPQDGVIALQVDTVLAPSLASRVAAHLQAQLLQEDAIYDCRTKAPRCTMRVAGAFIIGRILVSDPERVHVEVWTSVSYASYGGRVYFRHYSIDVRREGNSDWQVHESRLLSVS
jgi:hypothetical protein